MAILHRAGGQTVGWVGLLLVVALVTWALQVGLSAGTRAGTVPQERSSALAENHPSLAPGLADDDASGARWLASLAGPDADGNVVGASGAVGYATPGARAADITARAATR